MISPEDKWQRNTDYPTAKALLSFLEADLDRGLRLLQQAGAEARTREGVSSALLDEVARVEAEIGRWISRAQARTISVGHLRPKLDRFEAAVAALGGTARDTSQ